MRLAICVLVLSLSLVHALLLASPQLPRLTKPLKMSLAPEGDNDDPLSGDDVAASSSEDPLRGVITAAGVAANPVAIASLVSLQTTGCSLPAGPFGLLRGLETVSYLIVAGIVFSWTPEAGGLGSAGLELSADDSDSRSGSGGSGSGASAVSLTGAVEVLSWVVFTVGFLLLVRNLIAPVGPGLCAGVAVPLDESSFDF